MFSTVPRGTARILAAALCLGIVRGPGVGAQAAPQVVPSSRTPVDVSKLGPQVGESIPDFQLLDQDGRLRTLRSIAGRRGAMLVFIRSADW